MQAVGGHDRPHGRRGVAWLGGARRGTAGKARRGKAWQGWAWQGMAGHGGAWLGKARLARLGVAWHGSARRGKAWLARHGTAWRGEARHGWQGVARQGSAWHGAAGLGKEPTNTKGKSNDSPSNTRPRRYGVPAVLLPAIGTRQERPVHTTGPRCPPWRRRRGRPTTGALPGLLAATRRPRATVVNTDMSFNDLTGHGTETVPLDAAAWSVIDGLQAVTSEHPDAYAIIRIDDGHLLACWVADCGLDCRCAIAAIPIPAGLLHCDLGVFTQPDDDLLREITTRVGEVSTSIQLNDALTPDVVDSARTALMLLLRLAHLLDEDWGQRLAAAAENPLPGAVRDVWEDL